MTTVACPKLIGYLHIRAVDAIRYPIFDTTDINFPSTILEHQKTTNELIIVVVSQKMLYKEYEEELKNPLFPEYIYINDIQVKNVNNENGKRIIENIHTLKDS